MTPKHEQTIKDVVIIGAGPAGLSALLWCADLGLEVAIVERQPQPGGQLHAIHNPIKNYLGRESRDGREMLNFFLAQTGELLEPQLLSVGVSSVDAVAKQTSLSDGRTISTKAIILATGVRRRRLGIDGETEFAGRGILNSGSKERESVPGKRVVIVGGGDAALENALILADHAAAITVVHRRNEFSGRREFVDAASRNPKVKFIFNAELTRITGERSVESVEIKTAGNGRVRSIPTDAVLIRIGVQPNSELVRDQAHLDERGYVIVDRDSQTNIPGLYAVGDVANPTAPTLSTAAGSGAAAAKAAFSFLYPQNDR